MTKISRSPERHTFQAKNKDGSKYDAILDQIRASDFLKESDPAWQKDNLEYDLRTTDWILQKVRDSESYAQNLYAAMCNNEFQRLDTWPILTDQRWSCSWRYAGGIVAHMRQTGDYIDWYCSGIRDIDADKDSADLTEEQRARQELYSKFVSESQVTDEIREDLQKLGWIVV